MEKVIRADLSTNGIKKIQQQLTTMQRKLKKYDGEHTVSLPYSQEEWDNMTEFERNEVIEEAKKKYIDEIKKDLFK